MKGGDVTEYDTELSSTFILCRCCSRLCPSIVPDQLYDID